MAPLATIVPFLDAKTRQAQCDRTEVGGSLEHRERRNADWPRGGDPVQVSITMRLLLGQFREGQNHAQNRRQGHILVQDKTDLG